MISRLDKGESRASRKRRRPLRGPRRPKRPKRRRIERRNLGGLQVPRFTSLQLCQFITGNSCGLLAGQVAAATIMQQIVVCFPFGFRTVLPAGVHRGHPGHRQLPHPHRLQYWCGPVLCTRPGTGAPETNTTTVSTFTTNTTTTSITTSSSSTSSTSLQVCALQYPDTSSSSTANRPYRPSRPSYRPYAKDDSYFSQDTLAW